MNPVSELSQAPGTDLLSGRWFRLAAGAASLCAAGAVAGLAAADEVYGRESTALADAATAQDLVGLLLVAPCWSSSAGGRFAGRALRWPAWLLIAIGVLFTMLWLREILPAVVSGAPSPSASAWQVPTNPVHVLDLAFFLPATATSGILLLRRHRLGYTTAPGQLTWLALTWLALTCLPILITPLVVGSRGHQPDWALAGPVGVILLASLGALAWLLRQPANGPSPR